VTNIYVIFVHVSIIAAAYNSLYTMM